MKPTKNGYIKLYRSIIDWEWFEDRNTRDVFLYLLLNANWKETEWKGVSLKPGQLIIGRKKLAASLGLSERAVRTALSRLQKTGEIDQQTTNRWTLVTVENWAKYQADDDASDQPNANKRPASDQQVTTDEERKHVRTKDGTLVAYSDFVTAWNSICVDLPKVRNLSKERKDKLKTRLKTHSKEQIIEAMRLTQESDFLCGRNGGRWRADFDWLIHSTGNVQRVLEGSFANHEKKYSVQADFDAARRRIYEQLERASDS